MIRVIKKTQNPVAHLAIHNLANGIEQVAKVIAHTCDKEKVTSIQDRLLKDFTDAELDEQKLAYTPEYLLALLALTKGALINYIK